jgi:hypothetical protein
VSVDNQTERIRGGDGVRQLLLDARRRASRGPCVQRCRETTRPRAAIPWRSSVTRIDEPLRR